MKGSLCLLVIGLSVSLFQGQQTPRSNPPDSKSKMSHEEMNERGDQVMGFDHMKTTHHFRLFRDGGAIEITANSAADIESRDQIRMHLGHIAKMFGEGDFKAPRRIHGQTPQGVPAMQKLKKEITYTFQEIDQGASIRISTKDAAALKAIHSFLRFQIKEHKTGDSLEVSK